MIFIRHSELEGTHAFLSPSNNAWTNYSEEKLAQRYLTAQAVQRGTELHAFACDAIRLNRRQPKTKETLCMYVNDAIGFRELEAPMKQLYIYAALFCLEYGAYADGLRKKGLNDSEIADVLKLRPNEVHFAPEKMDDIVLRIYQFNDIKEEHPLNKEFIFVTTVVSKLDKSNDFKEEHPANNELISFILFKLSGNLISSKEAQFSNIDAIFVTEDKSNPDKSIDFTDLTPLNKKLISFTEDVIKLERSIDTIFSTKGS